MKRFLFRHWQWLAWALTAAVVVLGIRRVTFEVDVTALLPPSIKETRALQRLLVNSTQKDEVILLVEGPARESTDACVNDLVKALRARPDVAAEVMDRAPIPKEIGDAEGAQVAEAAGEIVASAWLNQKPEKWRELEKRMAAGNIVPRLDKLREDMATSLSMTEGLGGYDPMGLFEVLGTHLEGGIGNFSGGFESPDGRSRILFVHARESPKDYLASKHWVEQLHEVADPIVAAHPGSRFSVTGHAAFESEGGQAMQHDMLGSGVGSLVLTAGIFWLFFRRLRPLVLVVFALLLVAVITFGIGGLAVPGMNIMTAGFAGILIGLAVDYGILVYQESLNEGDPQAVRRVAVRGIAAAAGTTAAAFGALAVCTVPGISQLGILTGIGILVGAAVMGGPYCSWIFKAGRRAVEPGMKELAWMRPARTGRILAWGAVAFCGAGLIGLAVRGMPRFDGSLDSVQLRNSKARATLEHISEVLGAKADPMQIVVDAPSGAAADPLTREQQLNIMAERLESLAPVLSEARDRNLLASAALPVGLVPFPARQRENLPAAGRMAADEARVLAAVEEAGFEARSVYLMRSVFAAWRRWAAAGTFPAVPESARARWAMERFLPSRADPPLALGIIRPLANPRALTDFLHEPMNKDGVVLLSMETVADALKENVPKEILPIGLALVAGVGLMLWITFRRWSRLGLCAGVMMLNAGVLLGYMGWFGLEWNFVNLGAMLLAVGAGIDYSIHILLSLDRHRGDAGIVRATTGRALFGCCLTTAAGFASLAGASIPGLASLGIICGLALLINLVIAVCLLPLAWR